MLPYTRQTNTTSRNHHSSGYGATNNRDYLKVRDRVQDRLLAELNPAVSGAGDDEVQRALARIFGETVAELNLPLSRSERALMLDMITADILGLGPLEALLRDESITEILVNGPQNVFVERHGSLQPTAVQFSSNEDVMRIIERIVAPIGPSRGRE